MDLSRIFMKNASPTKVGGQAILEGLMMRGSRALSVAIREPNGNIHLSVEPLKPSGVWKKIPVLRGVVSFVSSLVTGTSVLLYGAEVLESFEGQEGAVPQEKDALTLWLEKRFDEDTAFKIEMYISVVLAILLTVVLFILAPTFIMNLISRAGLKSVLLLNLCEGLLRICMFVAYIAAVSKMPDIRRVFEYHGAEHKTIHCYENGLELTPENAQSFYTLHPRCGTSFMMFVMVISLLVFSLFGWPNLALRVVSRLVMIPVIAGLSYELLQWTGRHDGRLVRLLSLPGILLQRLTTREPDEKQLEVAIAAMNAVLPSHEDPSLPVSYWVGHLTPEGAVKDEEATEALRRKREGGEKR
ncbi:MAG: DUF1385 domain-containing protein [Firmicutes bacterium]|nr:DUF1385 domain-containing protein [Bacillota bacterium]